MLKRRTNKVRKIDWVGIIMHIVTVLVLTWIILSWINVLQHNSLGDCTENYSKWNLFIICLRISEVIH